MIGILLNDSAYEQDIRELLMAFYPGQTFAHEMQEDLDFFVEGTVNEDRTEFTLCLGYFGSSCFHLLSMEKLEPEIPGRISGGGGEQCSESKLRKSL